MNGPPSGEVAVSSSSCITRTKTRRTVVGCLFDVYLLRRLPRTRWERSSIVNKARVCRLNIAAGRLVVPSGETGEDPLQ